MKHHIGLRNERDKEGQSDTRGHKGGQMGTSKKDIEGQAKRQRERQREGQGDTRGTDWDKQKKRERESNKSDFSTLGIEYYQAPNLIACAWACWTEIDSRGILGLHSQPLQNWMHLAVTHSCFVAVVGIVDTIIYFFQCWIFL